MGLVFIKDRIIVSVDLEYKNSWTFEDGTKIRLERKFDCFDQKYTQPVNAIVVDAENIPSGSEILIHHNSTNEVNQILNYKQVSGTDIASTIKYFSIPVADCFAWLDENKEWQPFPGYDFALQIFKPYNGVLEGIEPTMIKDMLWINTGEYKNKAVITLKASNYKIIFQDINGREGNLIRVRSSEHEKTQRECEIVAIHNEYTDKVLNGELIVGITKSDAKPIKEHQLCLK